MKPAPIFAALFLAFSVPFLQRGAYADYDTAIFTAKNQYCSKVQASGGVVVDRSQMIDRAVLYAMDIWKKDVSDRYAFRSRVVQAINSEGCGSPVRSPSPLPAASAPSAGGGGAEAYGGACVAVINGVRVGGCTGRF